jgi:hypothetical protein
VKGQDRYLYRALDSTGQTIEFLLAAKRDKAAAKRFLVKTIEASGNPMPRVNERRQKPGSIQPRWKRIRRWSWRRALP